MEEIIVKGISYQLVAGSFKEQDNAVRLLTEVTQKGFDAEIVKTDEDFYRVCLKSYTSKSEAISDRDKLSESFPDIWISKK